VTVWYVDNEENEMNNHYRIYRIVVEKGETDDGAKLEWSRGCNGENHTDCLDKVFYDEDGGVEFAEHLATVERGECNSTCGVDRLGGFLYPLTIPAEPELTACSS